MPFKNLLKPNKIGKNADTKQVRSGKSVFQVGRFTYGYEGIKIKQWGEGATLKIGSFCSISSALMVFLGGNHRIDWISTFPFGHVFQDELGGEDIKGHPATNGDVIIGDDVWIGHGVTIMSGITIGSGAVIAANSNVVKNVLPYEIVGGNPAKLIKKRFDDDIIALLLTLKWWELPIDDIKAINKTLCSAPNLELLEGLVNKYR